MLKKSYFLLFFILLHSCMKEKEKANPYFQSNKIYPEILIGINKLSEKNENKYYYIFNYSDTIIMTSVKGISGCLPCGGARKKGSFNYKNKIIIVTEPLNVKPYILKTPNALVKNNMINMIDTSVRIEKNPIGIIYKIDSEYNMKEVYNGDVSLFLNKKDYTLHPKN